MDELWDVRLVGRENEPLWQSEEDARRLIKTYREDGVPSERVQVVRKSDGAWFSVGGFLNATEEGRKAVVWAGDRVTPAGATGVELPDGCSMIRTPIPGGWLVCLFGQGLTFVPDEDHAWDGRSVWRDLGRRPGLADLGGVPAE